MNYSFSHFELSRVIDPNPNFEWRFLTSNELADWYTATDLCMMATNDTVLFPMKIRERQCSNQKKPKVKGCGLGLGHLGQPCFQPLITRTHYRKGIIGFTDGKRPILTETMINFAKNNISIVFVGDSTTRQKVIAMDCQLKRESWKSYIYPLNYGRTLPCYSKMTIVIDRGEYTVDLHQIGMGPNAVDCMEKETISKIKGKRTYYSRMFENAELIVNHINQIEQKRVFVLANMGLWFNDEESLTKATPGVLDWLRRVSEISVNNLPNVVAWHETLHQHYENEFGNGYYFKHLVEQKEELWRNGTIDFNNLDLSKWHDPMCCQSINNFSAVLDWRNNVVRTYMMEQNYLNKYIIMLPFAKATENLSDMHICHPHHKDDCTHYCLWPLLFQPLWYQLYNISSHINK